MYHWFISSSIIFITNFLLVQLFINLFIWPFFLSWGLPLTPLSIIGNLIFGPFLTLFLILSSLATTCELLTIPNYIFLYPLELTTRLWLWIIQCSTPDCMITFINPPLLLSLCAPILATTIMLTKKLKTKPHKIVALFFAYIILMILFSLYPQPDSLEILYGNNIIKIINENGKLTLIDEGFTRRKSGINQWINYTLLPFLGKKFGRQKLDTVIIKKKSPNTLLFAELLQQRVRAKIIIFEDERVKTTPSFRAVPSTLSRSPLFQNQSTLQSQESENGAIL